MATSKEQWQEFLEKMDWEGGICGLIGHSGTRLFPAELKFYAGLIELSIDKINKEISIACEQHGIQY